MNGGYGHDAVREAVPCGVDSTGKKLDLISRAYSVF